MEEFMKSPFAIIGSTLCLIAAAFFVYYNNKKKNKDKRNVNTILKRIDVLSYEYIIEESKQLLTECSYNKEKRLALSVVPNGKAVEFYNSREGKLFFSSMELSIEDVSKMVLLSIMENDEILTTEIIVPNVTTSDYSDFVHRDKIYIKKIKVDDVI